MLDKTSEIVLKYIIDCYNSGKSISFIEISNHLDIQVQDLKIIFDFLIENEYLIIFNTENTNIDWSKYNGVPSIKGRLYFENQKIAKKNNIFKYSFTNIFIPMLVSLITALIATLITG